MIGLQTRLFLSNLLLCAVVIVSITFFATRETLVAVRDEQRLSAGQPDIAALRSALEANYRRHNAWVDIGPVMHKLDQRLGVHFVVLDRGLHVVGSSSQDTTNVTATRQGDLVRLRFTQASIDKRELRDSQLAIGLGPDMMLKDQHGSVVGFVIPLPVEALSIESTMGNVNRRLWWAALISLVAALLASIALSRYLLRPITALTAAAGRLSHGDFSQRVNARGHDELAALGRSFNSMAGDLEAAEQLRRDMTSDIAHELGTPLHNLQGQVEALQDGLAQPTAANLESLHEEIVHLSSLVRDLADINLADAGKLQLHIEPVAVADLIESLKRAVASQAGAKNVEVATEIADDSLIINADYRRLRQILLNLLTNAVRYTPSNSTINITAGPENGNVRVSVADQGPGLRPEETSKVFERFYRSDPSRDRASGGAGLGLAIAKRLVEAHGGTIQAQAGAARGALFVFTIPSTQSVE
jgi:signal transduction histidine kinase